MKERKKKKLSACRSRAYYVSAGQKEKYAQITQSIFTLPLKKNHVT